jgi:hypothetical protein
LIQLESGIHPVFGGHEKFTFRHGWLKKGVDAVKTYPGVFTQDDGLVVLGVGKNMVRSIRHWCLATGMLTEGAAVGRTPRTLFESVLSQKLLTDTGWDPFLEDSASLWLLHWSLVCNYSRALVWHITFADYYVTEFTKKQIFDFLAKELDHLSLRTTAGSIERELECCLRTYVPGRVRVGGVSEETFDCPLAELELIRYIPEDNIYRFNVGPKASLPAEVYGFALLQFLARSHSSQRTFNLEECIYGYGSPSQVFKLDENSSIEYLETLERISAERMRLVDNSGIRQLSIDESVAEFQDYGMDLLSHFYSWKQP